MEKNDHIFEQIKQAAQADQTEFASLDRVWARVENKLDSKVLQKENTLWKKLAVAASILAVISLGYHYWDKEADVAEEQQVVVDKTVKLPETTEQTIANAVKDPEPESKNSQPSINKPVSTFITYGDTIAYHGRTETVLPLADKVSAVPQKAKEEVQSSSGKWLKGKVFEARSVDNAVGFHTDVQTSLVPQQNAPAPLVVIDGKAVKRSMAKNSSAEMVLKDEDIESAVVLKEPLYIINGVEYSEESLFSPNPTSPYAPLSEQDIQSIEILQDRAATDRFGEKGSKGVVIIKTQGGRPKAK